MRVVKPLLPHTTAWHCACTIFRILVCAFLDMADRETVKQCRSCLEVWIVTQLLETFLVTVKQNFYTVTAFDL
jgi:hypothetical protein